MQTLIRYAAFPVIEGCATVSMIWMANSVAANAP